MPLTAKEADRLVDVIKSFVKGGQTAPAAGDAAVAEARLPRTAITDAADRAVLGPAVFDDAALEDLYGKFKARLLEELQVDPIFLRILASRPEVEVLVEPRRLQLDDKSLRGRIGILMARGVISKNAVTQRAEIVAELAATGTSPAGNRMSEALISLVNDGLLVRDGEGGYKVAPGVKVRETIVSSQ